MPDTVIDIIDLDSVSQPGLGMFATITDPATGQTFKISYTSIRSLLGIDAIEGAAFGGSVVPASAPAPVVKTFYFAVQAGTYSSMGGFIVAANTFAIISWDTHVWSISQTPLVLTPYLNKTADVSDVIQPGANLFNPALVISGKLIDNTGAIANNAGYKMIKVGWPSTSVVGSLAVFGGLASNHVGAMYCRYYDSTGALINSVFQYTPGTTRSIGVPAGGAGGGIYITIRAVEDTSDAGFAQAIMNMGTVLLNPYVPYTETHWIKQIDSKFLQAKYIDADSVCPTPVLDVHVSNKLYVDQAKAAAILNTNTNAVLNANIGIETDISNNLANPALIEVNKVIDNTGAYITFTGYKSIVIPIDASNLNIAWKGINSLGSCYGRFFDASGNGLSSLINTTPNGNEYTRAIPAGATKVIFTIRAPADSSDSGFATLMINYGPTAITPYVPYSSDYVVSINGKQVKSGAGQAYDQLLNTTNNVQFNRVTTPLLNAASLVIQHFAPDLPQWSGTGTPPSNILIGDVYINSTTGAHITRLT